MKDSPSTDTLKTVVIGACIEIRKLEYQYANDSSINDQGYHDDKVRTYISMRDKCIDEIIEREANDQGVQDSRD